MHKEKLPLKTTLFLLAFALFGCSEDMKQPTPPPTESKATEEPVTATALVGEVVIYETPEGEK